jgi:hypothetical protein
MLYFFYTLLFKYGGEGGGVEETCFYNCRNLVCGPPHPTDDVLTLFLSIESVYGSQFFDAKLLQVLKK